MGVIGGAPKCSKTWLALDMSLSVATGTACLDRYEVPEPGPADADPLEVPLVEEFRVGAIAFGWDPSSDQMLFELHGQTADDDVDPTELGDDDDGPAVLRVRTTLLQAVDFIARARKVVEAGRPPCPFCQQPLDPAGHICPRANGYRR